MKFTFISKGLCYMQAFLFLLFANSKLIAQTPGESNITVAGYIHDSLTNEKLIGATVLQPASNYATVANGFGFYHLTIDQEKEPCLYISHLGYKTKKVTIVFGKDTIVNISLSPTEFEIDEVSVSSRSIKTETPGMVNVPMTMIQSAPVIFGEPDVLKTIQMLPGVQGGMEGTSGLIVRGGGPGENMILLDDAPVYNISHFFGFFSVFTPEAISNVTLIKGGFPARYGERASSILDVRMKNGNNQSHHGTVNAGLISMKTMFEGPIIKNKMSYMLSARRTLYDILLLPLLKGEGDGFKWKDGYFFHDLNMKVNYNVNDKNKLYFSFYTGKDKFFQNYTHKVITESWVSEDKTETGLGWGNNTFTFRYNKIISPSLFSNISFIYAGYKYQLSTETKSGLEYTQTGESENYYEYTRFESRIRDLSIKPRIDFLINDNNKLQTGFLLSGKLFAPGSFHIEEKSGSDGTVEHIDNLKINTFEVNPYIDYEVELWSKFRLNAGFRLGMYSSNKEWFISPQPRLMLDYFLNIKNKITGAYTQMAQPVHLLANSGIGLPSDQWMPATKKVPVQTSDQYSLGYVLMMKRKTNINIDIYYKYLQNVIEYKEGADLLNTTIDWQDKVEVGNGKSYGLEVLLKKDIGKMNGWIGYSLSKSTRQFEKINNNNPFSFKYDRRHSLKTLLVYKLNERIDISTGFILMGGSWMTIPSQIYPLVGDEPELEIWNMLNEGITVDETLIDYIPSRNNVQMQTYHRLDAGISFKKQKKKFKRTWSMSVYNLYARQNPIFYYYESNRAGLRKVKQFSLFPIIPTISYQIQF